MKFAQQLKQLERECAVQWRGKFIKYRELKKMIKKCRRAREEIVFSAGNDAQGCSVDQVEANDQRFFRALETEVKAVNRNFEKAAHEVLAASKRHQMHAKVSCLSFLRRKPLDELSAEELAAASAWCRQFATVNAMGLRKIAKKHDKYCGGSAGSRFLQSCWDASNLKFGSFLHSPLMDELKAVEEQLNSQVPQKPAKQAAQPQLRRAVASGHDGISPPPGSPPVTHTTSSPDVAMEDAHSPVPAGAAGAAGQRGAHAEPRSVSLPVSELSPPPGELGEDSFVCHICLEPMYMPLGLTCGHKFCTDCILHAAGLDDAHGSLKTVLAEAPPNAACPECRQTGVFEGALLMKKLGGAINRRYPQEMRQQAKEASRKRAAGRRPPWYDKVQDLMAPFAAGL